MWGSTRTVDGGNDGERSDKPAVPGLIPVAAQGGSVVSLDESGLGRTGWRALGEAALERADADAPGAVSHSETTLRLHGRDELAPTLALEAPVRDADLPRHRSLTATVRAGDLRGTDAPVQFRVRLLHDATGRGPTAGRQRSTRSGRGSDSAALRSRPFRAPQGVPIRLYWDLRDVDDAVLDRVRRLEVVCERTDRPRSEGPYGRVATGVRGRIDVSSVVLSDSPDAIATAKLQNRWLDLEAAAGPHEDTVTECRTGAAESGRFVFADGTEVNYDFEVCADGTHLFTLGETIYRFQDGMAAVEPR